MLATSLARAAYGVVPKARTEGRGKRRQNKRNHQIPEFLKSTKQVSLFRSCLLCVQAPRVPACHLLMPPPPLNLHGAREGS